MHVVGDTNHGLILDLGDLEGCESSHSGRKGGRRRRRRVGGWWFVARREGGRKAPQKSSRAEKSRGHLRARLVAQGGLRGCARRVS